MTSLLEQLRAGLPGHYRIDGHLAEGVRGFRAGRSELVVERSFLSTFAWNHDMAPDGRLLVLLSSPERQTQYVGVITGFPSAVERFAGATSKSH